MGHTIGYRGTQVDIVYYKFSEKNEVVSGLLFFYRCKCPGPSSLTEAPILSCYPILTIYFFGFFFVYVLFCSSFWFFITVRHLFSYVIDDNLRMPHAALVLRVFSASGNGLHFHSRIISFSFFFSCLTASSHCLNF